MAVSGEEFRRALRSWASGVTVVTAHHEGVGRGMTVSSFASVSLSPPLVSVCLATGAGTLRCVQQSGAFGVNILASEQEVLSEHFASDAVDRFAGIATRNGRDGVPLIEGALCQLECRVFARHVLGDHELVVGEVMAVHCVPGSPLAYYEGTYGTFEPDGAA